MAQDLKKLFEEQRKKKPYSMKSGHEERFLEKLEGKLHKKRNSFYGLKIAASIVIMLGLASYFFINNDAEINTDTTIVNNTDTENVKSKISLGNLSPDLKKIENYYTTNISIELSLIHI